MRIKSEEEEDLVGELPQGLQHLLSFKKENNESLFDLTLEMLLNLKMGSWWRERDTFSQIFQTIATGWLVPKPPNSLLQNSMEIHVFQAS